MAKFKDFFKFVSAAPKTSEVANQQGIDGSYASYGNYTWYQRLVQGSATRLTRYREYDLMDNDVEVSRALDIIGEEMCRPNSKTNLLFDIEVQGEKGQNTLTEAELLTLRTTIRHWSTLHNWDTRLFKLTRNTVKFGDCFFKRKNDFKMWEWIPPSNVIAAVVDAEDVTKVVGYQVRIDTKEPKSPGGLAPVNQGKQIASEYIPATDMVRFTLNDDMSDLAPFGESILRPIYKTHKQKELLEDAIIIYRIQRAPERRVFYIDVGKMPPQRVKQYLESLKNEIRQKKVPSRSGGQDSIDSVYNPQSMTEDFFFAQRPDGRGSKVESLPGGQGLGEMADLDYFQDKVFRGLRVPVSWMKYQQQNGLAILNDGKPGQAYIEELRFALFVERLQTYVEVVIDKEFKRFLRACNVRIDDASYKLKLSEPSNFARYRQAEIDQQLLSIMASAEGVPYLAKRFNLTRFLQLTEDELVQNEMLLRQERGLPPQSNQNDLPQLYGGGEAQDGLALGGGGGMPAGGGGIPPGGPMGGEVPPGEEGAGGVPGAPGDLGGVPGAAPGGAGAPPPAPGQPL